MIESLVAAIREDVEKKHVKRTKGTRGIFQTFDVQQALQQCIERLLTAILPDLSACYLQRLH